MSKCLFTIQRFEPDLLEVTFGLPNDQEGAPESSGKGLTTFKAKSSVRMARFFTSDFEASFLKHSSLFCNISISCFDCESWYLSFDSLSDSRRFFIEESFLRSTSNWKSFLSTFSNNLIRFWQISFDLFSTVSREMLKGRWIDDESAFSPESSRPFWFWLRSLRHFSRSFWSL